jgi:hypothetical protein
MKFSHLAAFLALVLGFGLADAGAQAFFPNRVKGTFEVKFLPPAGGQTVQVLIDDQPVGFLPATVYVTPGAHKFSFLAPGEEPKTMVYPVKGDTVVPSLFTAQSYPLTVNTNVPGASLAIDGRPFPGNATSVTPGNHTLAVSAPGYLGVTVPFNQPANANVLNVTLVASTFPLTVNTNVPGANLAVDNQPFPGNQTTVAPGSHTLTVSAPGYQSLSVPFNQPNHPHILNVTLVASTFPLTVNTNVPGASLAVDNQPFPGNQTAVTAGNHTLTVSAPGYQSLVVPFNQPAGANVLNVTLVASTGTLVIGLDRLPQGQPYRVSIDGKEVRGNSLALVPGNHTVRITSGGLLLETSVALAAGQTLTVTPSVQWDVR